LCAGGERRQRPRSNYSQRTDSNHPVQG
jgi:hypothetical protein